MGYSRDDLTEWPLHLLVTRCELLAKQIEVSEALIEYFDISAGWYFPHAIMIYEESAKIDEAREQLALFEAAISDRISFDLMTACDKRLRLCYSSISDTIERLSAFGSLYLDYIERLKSALSDLEDELFRRFCIYADGCECLCGVSAITLAGMEMIKVHSVYAATVQWSDFELFKDFESALTDLREKCVKWYLGEVLAGRGLDYKNKKGG